VTAALRPSSLKRPFGSRCRSVGLPCSPLDVACYQAHPRGITRAPFARPVPERTARCEPPRLGTPPRVHALPREPDSSHTHRPGRFNGHSPGPSTHRRHRSAAGMCLLPLHRHAVAASTPALDPKVARFGFEVPPSKLVPSSWFCTTSTASSAAAVAGLLHPAADPGIHRVSGSRRPAIKPLVSRPPRDAGPAPRRIPLDSRSASPRSLPPCRSLTTTASMPTALLPARRGSGWEGRDRRLRGVAPSSGLVSHVAVAGDRRPAPSWASFLFKVASRAAGDPSPTAWPDSRHPRRNACYVAAPFLSRSGHAAEAASWFPIRTIPPAVRSACHPCG